VNAVILFVIFAAIEHPVIDALFNALIQVSKPIGWLGYLIILAVIICVIALFIKQFLVALASGIV